MFYLFINEKCLPFLIKDYYNVKTELILNSQFNIDANCNNYLP